MFNLNKTELVMFTKLSLILIFALALIGCDQPPAQVSFNAISASDLNNAHLVCPPDYCNNDPQDISPVYSVKVENLDYHLQEVVTEDPALSVIAADKVNHKYTYIHQDKYLPLPRYIHVELIALNNNHSTLALYYKSKYSFIDFGDSKEIVQDLLNKLQISLSRHQSHEDDK